MPLPVFDFPYHRVSTTYPESSIRVRFGRSYQFASKPNAPPERLFKLRFPTMKYYTKWEEGEEVLDTTINPKLNLYVLEQFYQAVELYGTFTYPHPVHGNLTVRFSKPLVLPEGRENGNGASEEFDIELIEVP
jgi:hypothetical protein